MTQGKRGPKGGVIDIDDPYERPTTCRNCGLDASLSRTRSPNGHIKEHETVPFHTGCLSAMLAELHLLRERVAKLELVSGLEEKDA